MPTDKIDTTTVASAWVDVFEQADTSSVVDVGFSAECRSRSIETQLTCGAINRKSESPHTHSRWHREVSEVGAVVPCESFGGAIIRSVIDHEIVAKANETRRAHFNCVGYATGVIAACAKAVSLRCA